MTFVTCANNDFRLCYDGLKERLEKLGYPLITFDIDDLGEGEKFEGIFPTLDRSRYTPKIPFKARMLRKAIEMTDDFIVYMDADAYPRERIDEVMEGDYDIGVTVHPAGNKREHKYAGIVSYLNAGVVFIRNNYKARKFLDYWISATENSDSGSDQEGLTTLVGEAVDFEQDAPYEGMLDDIKIKCFPAPIYNYTFIDRIFPDHTAKILHYVGQWKVNHYGKY